MNLTIIRVENHIELRIEGPHGVYKSWSTHLTRSHDLDSIDIITEAVDELNRCNRILFLASGTNTPPSLPYHVREHIKRKWESGKNFNITLGLEVVEYDNKKETA